MEHLSASGGSVEKYEGRQCLDIVRGLKGDARQVGQEE